MIVWIVGGYVRDTLMGLPSKDIDFAVEAPSFEAMVAEFVGRGFEIWQERPEFLTVRCHIPKGDALRLFGPKDADFVMCRSEGAYSDGRHPDEVVPGTIFDDLARRDFTMNAIAINPETKEMVDPHGGFADIENRVLACVGSAQERFTEDALRALRAIRFMHAKGLTPTNDILQALTSKWLPPLVVELPVERVYEELRKIFTDPVRSLPLFMGTTTPDLREAIFRDKMSLEPKIRG